MRRSEEIWVVVYMLAAGFIVWAMADIVPPHAVTGKRSMEAMIVELDTNCQRVDSQRSASTTFILGVPGIYWDCHSNLTPSNTSL